MCAHIHYSASVFFYQLYTGIHLESPSHTPTHTLDVGGRCDDCFSVYDTRAVSPHSVQLMTSKNSINALPMCSFFPNILFSLYFNQTHPIFLSSLCSASILISPSSLIALCASLSWTVPSLYSLCCCPHTCNFTQFCLYARVTWVNLIRCWWVQYSVTHPMKWGHSEASPFILNVVGN